MKNSILKSLFVLLLNFSFSHAAERPLQIAVIGGMVSSGMWQEVASAFSQESGIETQIAISGNKEELDAYVREHRVDLITMHSSDTISDLVADGLFERLTPWAKNAQMIVGSKSNPAHIEPNDTLPEALKKIEQSRSPFLVHPSGGTFEVANALFSHYNFRPNTIFVQQKRGFLKSVVQSNGYTLFGVIPFLLHKEHHEDIRGYHITDRKLQRPYLAAVAAKDQEGSARYDAALKLLSFLTSQRAQDIIQKVRIPGYKEHQLFFSVSNFKE